MGYVRISSLTDTELINLTDEDKLQIIDFECAERGIPFLPQAPGPKPEKPDVKRIQVWAVAGFYFLKLSEAEQVMSVINKCRIYTTDGWGSTIRLRQIPNDDSYARPKIETLELPTAEQYALVEREIYAYEKLVKAWENVKSSYDKVLKDRQVVANELNDAIEAATDKQLRISGLWSKFLRYVEMAKGDLEIATRFMNSAENPDPEEWEHINQLLAIRNEQE